MNTPSMSRQAGITLAVTMIFLIMLAVFGVTAMRSNSLQERMAGNTRNRDLALQAAEHALKDAEAAHATWRAAIPASGCSSGLCASVINKGSYNNEAAYWRDANNWSSYQSPSNNLNQVAEQPRYIVESLGNTSETIAGTTYNYANYRITARGVGGDINAVVVLQSKIRIQI
jgi:type IV pilus assembly protein PilX